MGSVLEFTGPTDGCTGAIDGKPCPARVIVKLGVVGVLLGFPGLPMAAIAQKAPRWDLQACLSTWTSLGESLGLSGLPMAACLQKAARKLRRARVLQWKACRVPSGGGWAYRLLRWLYGCGRLASGDC